ncbi:hypothetical protein Val02_73770 [Virgisporangium aliadipatigenens]|uniref:Uncharacterized protein n=1 Tax=Virgisporangium aliadipatigenens TaxID=741659 RepID=A0A8J3YS53_9ACTN|nr:hypothetical protein [Virgisporangium aliadipatigenens]GIJ50491.1 hypothetical protein Val02_73770 [Virgisporangium aliadipatigenens]
MAWFKRRTAEQDDVAHLEEFVRSRRGVEAYLEPRTTVTPPTMILIAHDGEWTRRRVPDERAARRFAEKQRIPVYDIALTGYPQRKRDWDERQKRSSR